MVSKGTNNTVKGSLDEIKKLTDEQKERLLDYCQQALDEVKETKGEAFRTLVILSKDKRKLLTLTLEDKDLKIPPKSVEEIINDTNLLPSIKQYLVNEHHKGHILKSHANDISTADCKTDISSLTEEGQKETVLAIIKNRNERNLKNFEEVAIALIKNLNFDPNNIDLWYKHIMSLCNELDIKIDVDNDLLNLLSNLDKKSLKLTLEHLANDMTKLSTELI